MSALLQKPTLVDVSRSSLCAINRHQQPINHHIGELLEMRRHIETQRLGRLEIKLLGRRIIGVDNCKAGIPPRREYRVRP